MFYCYTPVICDDCQILHMSQESNQLLIFYVTNYTMNIIQPVLILVVGWLIKKQLRT